MSAADFGPRTIGLYAAGAIGTGLLVAVASQFVGARVTDVPPPAIHAAAPISGWKAPAGRTQAELMDAEQPKAGAVAPVVAAAATWSYRNCREARAAGATPLYRGQPGYGPHMDGDNDGIACEPFRR